MHFRISPKLVTYYFIAECKIPLEASWKVTKLYKRDPRVEETFDDSEAAVTIQSTGNGSNCP